MSSLLKTLLNAVFSDPIIRDVDDDDLPLPEHRVNVMSTLIHDEPERKRIRAQGYMPAIVKAAMDNGGGLVGTVVGSPITRTAGDMKAGLTVLTSTRIATMLADGQRTNAAALSSSSTAAAAKKASASSSVKNKKKNTNEDDDETEETFAEDHSGTASASPKGSKKAGSAARAGSTSSTTAKAAKGSATKRARSTSKANNNKAAGSDDDDNEEPSEEWTVAEMRAYASTNNIALEGASRKTDILDKLLEARSI